MTISNVKLLGFSFNEDFELEFGNLIRETTLTRGLQTLRLLTQIWRKTSLKSLIINLILREIILVTCLISCCL